MRRRLERMRPAGPLVDPFVLFRGEKSAPMDHVPEDAAALGVVEESGIMEDPLEHEAAVDPIRPVLEAALRHGVEDEVFRAADRGIPGLPLGKIVDAPVSGTQGPCEVETGASTIFPS